MVGQLLEDVELSPKDSDGLESSVLFFKKASSDYTNQSATFCTERPGTYKYITVIQKTESCLVISFDIQLLETGQLSLLFINKSQFLL